MTMTNKTSLLRNTLLLCCIGGCLSAWAAPTTTPQSETDAEVAPAAVTTEAPQNSRVGIADPAAAADHVPNPSNTIKMLLELQAEPEPGASASASGRSAARPAGSRPGTPTPAANPFGRGESPFGASPELAHPPPTPGAPGAPRGGVEWQAAPGGNFSGGYGGAAGVAPESPVFSAPRQAASAGHDAAEQRWWMPSVWIRWVRENRQAVLIGAAVALGLAWASASRSSQRRR
jgi:hypothetical protein